MKGLGFIQRDDGQPDAFVHISAVERAGMRTLNEGDKLLIPVSRLHGSTVLSGECTYHQPIIPDEMLAQFL